MVVFALLLIGAGLVCLVLCMRDLGVLMLAAAAGFWLLPHLVGGPDMPAGFQALEQPQPAPPAVFKTAAGKRVKLADFRGRVVLVNLWATSCAPCQSEIPSFDRLQAMYQGDGLAVVALSSDNASSMTVRRYLQRNNVQNITPYFDADGSAAMALNVHKLPTTLLIDRDGNLVGWLNGAVQWDAPDAVALIRRYLDS